MTSLVGCWKLVQLLFWSFEVDSRVVHGGQKPTVDVCVNTGMIDGVRAGQPGAPAPEPLQTASLGEPVVLMALSSTAACVKAKHQMLSLRQTPPPPHSPARHHTLAWANGNP